MDLNDKKRKLCVCIVQTALALCIAVLYKFKIAPVMASRHLEEEILIPVLLIFIAGLAVVYSLLICKKKCNSLVNLVLYHFFVWAILLLIIGVTTECPVCSMDI